MIFLPDDFNLRRDNVDSPCSCISVIKSKLQKNMRRGWNFGPMYHVWDLNLNLPTIWNDFIKMYK